MNVVPDKPFAKDQKVCFMIMKIQPFGNAIQHYIK